MSAGGIPQALTSLSRWRYFHARLRWGTLGRGFVKNLTIDEALLRQVCPFVEGSPYSTEAGAIVNPRAMIMVEVYGTERPIDNAWPPLKSKVRDDNDITAYLDENGHNCSSEALEAALIMIQSGTFKSVQQKVSASLAQNSVFMITIIGDVEVDSVYQKIVKPRVQAKGFTIARADELRPTDLITTAIFRAIASSRFVIADLTRARPNSYYELGYAHALGKPGMILARVETERHFDVAGYRWNYWSPSADFGPEFESALLGVMGHLAGTKSAGQPFPGG